jgi:hypothetical protein
MKYVFLLTSKFRYVVLTYVCSLILASILFSIIESHTFFDSLYWACVTSLTIGYGDLAPVTVVGKTLAVVFGHFWIFFIIPSIISLIITNLIKDQNEFTHDEQEDIKKMLKHLVDKHK